jgi:hypothetical protein
MTLEYNKPFYRLKTDEEKAKEKGRTFTIWVNEEEEQLIEWAKIHLDIESDSKAIKYMAMIGKNLLVSTFGGKMLKYITRKERKRYSDFKDISKDFEQNLLDK